MSLIPTPQQMQLNELIGKLQAENAELRKECDELKARIDGGFRVKTRKSVLYNGYACITDSTPTDALLILDKAITL